MINALPLLLLAAAPVQVGQAQAVQAQAVAQAKPAAVQHGGGARAVATAVIVRAAIISRNPPKDGITESDRQYRTRRGVPTVEFY